jgi:hypothetical protein
MLTTVLGVGKMRHPSHIYSEIFYLGEKNNFDTVEVYCLQGRVSVELLGSVCAPKPGILDPVSYI